MQRLQSLKDDLVSKIVHDLRNLDKAGQVAHLHLGDRSIEARKGDARRGIGLGLYLVKLVALLHHGEAPVMDREGGGAIFRLLFP